MTERLHRLLNIRPQEFPRVLVAWLMVFLNRSSFVVGWSILLAIFLGEIGAQYLPILFLTNAFLTMIGTALYRPLLHRVRQELLITYTVLYGAAFLITAVAFLQFQTWVFFGLFLFSQSFFAAQLSILLSLFNEELFNPIESQRVFPILESGETFGTIASGLILSAFASSLAPYKFVILSVMLLLAILPLVLFFNARTMEIPRLHMQGQEAHHEVSGLWVAWKRLRRLGFLKGLMFVIFLHWAIMNLVEFQYTQAVQLAVAAQHHGTIEAQFAQQLGQLHVLIASCALGIQLLLGSRILTHLGLVWSMLLHPLLTMLNVGLMSFSYTLGSAALAKGGFEFTNILFKSAYDATYYGLPHELKLDAKEIMQGLMKPLGAVFGTLCILVISSVSSGYLEVHLLNGWIILLSLVMFVALYPLSQKYSELCEQHLSHKEPLPTRLLAVQIFGQKGHTLPSASLHKILRRPHESVVLREEVLRTLGLRENIESIGALLDALSEPQDRLRFAAMEALHRFGELRRHEPALAFSRYRTIETLERLLPQETDERVRESMVKFLYLLSADQFTAYVLHRLRGEGLSLAIQAAFIRMLRLFPDPNLPHFLTPYLQDKHVELRAAALIALWQFKDYRAQLTHHLDALFDSHSPEAQKFGLQVMATLKLTDYRSRAFVMLSSIHPQVKDAAILALAQIHEERVIPHLVDRMVTPHHEWFDETHSVLASLPRGFAERTEWALHFHVVTLLEATLSRFKGRSIHEMEDSVLHYLESLYTRIGAHHEAESLRKMKRTGPQ